MVWWYHTRTGVHSCTQTIDTSYTKAASDRPDTCGCRTFTWNIWTKQMSKLSCHLLINTRQDSLIKNSLSSKKCNHLALLSKYMLAGLTTTVTMHLEKIDRRVNALATFHHFIYAIRMRRQSLETIIILFWRLQILLSSLNELKL